MDHPFGYPKAFLFPVTTTKLPSPPTGKVRHKFTTVNFDTEISWPELGYLDGCLAYLSMFSGYNELLDALQWRFPIYDTNKRIRSQELKPLLIRAACDGHLFFLGYDGDDQRGMVFDYDMFEVQLSWEVFSTSCPEIYIYRPR